MRISDWSSDVCSSDLYESSHRIEDTLADCVAAFGADRAGVVARELTKLFETVLDGTLAELHARVVADANQRKGEFRSEEHTSELQSLMRISYAVFCLNKKKNRTATKKST